MIVKPDSFKLTKLPAFIVIDGVNGAGKSTLQKHIAGYLEGRRIPHITTREPGATELGKKIRRMILEENEPKMSYLAELFLFGADRAEHVEKVIMPALSKGVTVISDRYYYATTAFQGYGRGIDRKTIDSINSLAISGVIPDLWIQLDLDPAEGLRRNRVSQEKSGAAGIDSFEAEELAFHQRLRNGFKELATQVSEPTIVLDANQSPDSVWETVRGILERSLHANT